MFQIKEFQQVGDKIRIVIETDDLTTRLILRFLSEPDKFAEAFHYRVSTESRLYSSQKTKPEKMVHARRSRVDLLKKYREIPGSRVQRIRILKEMFMSERVEITLDRLAAKLEISFDEEKLHKKTLVNRSIRKGKHTKILHLPLIFRNQQWLGMRKGRKQRSSPRSCLWRKPRRHV